LKLSFVIPAYNEEAYLGKCLESVLEESKNKGYNLEIIVVNNASTDKTKEIAQSFPGIKVVDEPQKGLVMARKAGYLASSGDIIAHIDADTRLPKGWLDKVFSEFSGNPNLAALSGPYIYYDLPSHVRYFVRLFYYAGYVNHLFNHIVIRKGAMLQGGNFIVKREAFEKIGGFNLKFDFYGEDTDVAKRIQKVGKVKFSFDLPMHTSGRRLKKGGVIVSGIRYAVNHFWTILFNKPFTKKFRDIR